MTEHWWSKLIFLRSTGTICSYKSFCTATDLDGFVVIDVRGKRAIRYMHMYDKNPALAEYWRTFGEAGTVKIETDKTPKLNDRGVQCMHVGYE
jgi:hypothetical protein